MGTFFLILSYGCKQWPWDGVFLTEEAISTDISATYFILFTLMRGHLRALLTWRPCPYSGPPLPRDSVQLAFEHVCQMQTNTMREKCNICSPPPTTSLIGSQPLGHYPLALTTPGRSSHSRQLGKVPMPTA